MERAGNGSAALLVKKKNNMRYGMTQPLVLFECKAIVPHNKKR